MDKFLYNTSLNIYNRARRLVGKNWLEPNEFSITVPDDRLNLMFRSLIGEIEERLSLPFGLRFRKRWLQSAGNRAEAYCPESSITSEFIAHFDLPLANEILTPFLDNQNIEGNIPIHVRPMGISRHSAGPHLFNAIWNLGRMGEQEEARAICERMSRLAHWLAMHKKNIEGLYAHMDSRWFKTAACLTELRRSHPEVTKDHEGVRSIAFNSMVAMQLRAMSKIARNSGLDPDAERYEDMADQLSANMNELFWDEESGFYYDIVGDSVLRDITMSGFLALAGEVPDKAQAARMIEWLPMISDRRTMIGTEPRLAPLFRLVVDGLLKYGYVKEAADLADSVIEHISSMGDIDKFFMARISAMILLINGIAGYNRFPDRYVLFPKIPAKWTDSPITIIDGSSGTRINMILSADGKVNVKVSSGSGATKEISIQNFTFASIKKFR